MASSEMMSPLKGIERISEDLRLERKKASAALQEKARLRIELESLRQVIEQQALQISDLTQQEEDSFKEIQALKEVKKQKESDDVEQAEQRRENEANIAKLEQEKERLLSEIEKYVIVTKDKDTQIAAMKFRVESAESAAKSKEDVVADLKEEIQNIRDELLETEKKYMDTYKALADQASINDERRAQLQAAEYIEEGYNQMKDANADLRAEMEELLSINTSLNQQIRERDAQLALKAKAGSDLESSNTAMCKEKSDFLEEIENLQREREELLDRIQAEEAVSSTAQARAVSAAKGRELLELQLKEVRDAHSDALQNNNDLEEQVAASQRMINGLQHDLNKAKERVKECEHAVEEVAAMKLVVGEVDILRAQLNDVRKQLIRKDVEDETGTMAPSAILERETKGRQVYESIIEDLRAEIDTLNNRWHVTKRQLEDAMRKAAMVEQLEEERNMYKDLAKSGAIESQSMAVSASAAAERNVKTAHEKHSVLHNLSRTQSELEATKASVLQARAETAAVRDRMKEFHSGKINADKRAAELLAKNSILESTIEDMKQERELTAIEMEKLGRQNTELINNISDLKKKTHELQLYKQDALSATNKFEHLKSATTEKEQNLKNALDIANMAKETLQRQYEAVLKKAEIQRATCDNAFAETERMRAEADAAIAERDRCKREMAQQASQQNEKQLADLRREMAITVSEWKELEQEKTAKDQLIARMQQEIIKEKEKFSLQKMQAGLLEDRLRVVTQELQVYRSLDVYHSSMQNELQSYRNSASKSAMGLSSQGVRNNNNNNNNNNTFEESKSGKHGTDNSHSTYHNNSNSIPSARNIRRSHGLTPIPGGGQGGRAGADDYGDPHDDRNVAKSELFSDNGFGLLDKPNDAGRMSLNDVTSTAQKERWASSAASQSASGTFPERKVVRNTGIDAYDDDDEDEEEEGGRERGDEHEYEEYMKQAAVAAAGAEAARRAAAHPVQAQRQQQQQQVQVRPAPPPQEEYNSDLEYEYPGDAAVIQAQVSKQKQQQQQQNNSNTFRVRTNASSASTGSAAASTAAAVTSSGNRSRAGSAAGPTTPRARDQFDNAPPARSNTNHPVVPNASSRVRTLAAGLERSSNRPYNSGNLSVGTSASFVGRASANNNNSDSVNTPQYAVRASASSSSLTAAAASASASSSSSSSSAAAAAVAAASDTPLAGGSGNSTQKKVSTYRPGKADFERARRLLSSR